MERCWFPDASRSVIIAAGAGPAPQPSEHLRFASRLANQFGDKVAFATGVLAYESTITVNGRCGDLRVRLKELRFRGSGASDCAGAAKRGT